MDFKPHTALLCYYFMKLSQDFYTWIDARRDDDPARLRLRHGSDRSLEILQIESRRRFGAKLAATLARNPQFVFPTALSGEQATSDALAAYHESLIQPACRVLDLTAGLGIDAMAMAAKAASVTAVEIDPDVADALRLNASAIADNVEVVCDDCRNYLAECIASGRKFDVIFIDPARRSDTGSRTYALEDCSPDVVALLPDMLQVAPKVIIKASPMLDISHSLRVLDHVERVIVLGTTTECKELDFVISNIVPSDTDPEDITIEAVTVLGADEYSTFTFTRRQESEATINTGVPHPGQYILDPYPAVMKAGGMKLLCTRFGLYKLAANTHVWYGNAIPQGFPGRAYTVVETLPYASKHLKRYKSAHPRISVTARNCDITSEALRAKLGVKDGPGRLFAVSDTNSNRWLITTTD